MKFVVVKPRIKVPRSKLKLFYDAFNHMIYPKKWWKGEGVQVPIKDLPRRMNRFYVLLRSRKDT